MRKQLRDVLVLVATAVVVSACATARRPLMTQEQGTFAGGGTIVTAPGTFDAIKQDAYNGNAHFAMSDLNNLQVADQVSQFLASKGLNR